MTSEITVGNRLANRVPEVGTGGEANDLAIGDDRLAAHRIGHLLQREGAELASYAFGLLGNQGIRPQKSPLFRSTRQAKPASHGEVSGVMSVDQ